MEIGSHYELKNDNGDVIFEGTVIGTDKWGNIRIKDPDGNTWLCGKFENQ